MVGLQHDHAKTLEDEAAKVAPSKAKHCPSVAPYLRLAVFLCNGTVFLGDLMWLTEPEDGPPDGVGVDEKEEAMHLAL